MHKDKKIGIVIWLLSFALSLVSMFCLEQGLTPVFWITFGFICFAFISTLVLQLAIWKDMPKDSRLLLNMSPIILSNIYMIIQFPVGIIFSVCSSTISNEFAILLNFLIMAIAWIFILSGFVGNNHIEKVNSRQKNHHVEL